MIYLIGGAPRCGKTILGKRVAKLAGTCCLSTDMLCRVAMPVLPDSEELKALRERCAESQDGLFGFELYGPEDLLRLETATAAHIWPGIANLIKSSDRQQANTVIEGVHLLPGLVSQLKGQDVWPRIRCVFLVKRDLRLIADGLTAVWEECERDWLRPHLDSAERTMAAARMVQAKSDFYLAEAERQGFPAVNTESDFEARLQEAQALLRLP